MNYSFLKKVEGRVIYLIIFSILALTLLSSYLYLFKKPLNQYNTLKKNRIALELRVLGRDTLPTIIETLTGEITELHDQIFGTSEVVPAEEMLAGIFARLDGISVDQGVTLISVKPESSKPVQLFIETPFSIEVKGGYVNLYNWLFQVERQLAPMIVKKFTLSHSSGDKTILTMKLNLSSYQPMGEQI